MYYIFLSLICCLCWVGAKCQPEAVNNITRCDQLPRLQLRSPSVTQTSPFRVYRSNYKTENCTTGVVTGPGPGPDGNQSVTFILFQKTSLKFIVSVQPAADGMSASVAICGNASATTRYYSFLYYVNATTYVSCPYSCDPSGLALDVFRCYGHNSEDEAIIQRAIDQYMTNVPGYKDIFDSQEGCDNSPYCSDYF